MGSRGRIHQGIRRNTRTGQRVVFLALIIIAGCGLKSPQAPRWTVALKVPIASRSFDLPYIVDHAGVDGLQWLGDSGAAFRIERNLDTVLVGDNLTVAPVSTSRQFTVGQFDIATDTRTSTTLALADLYPGPVGLIAAFSAETRRTLPSNPGWSAVEIVNGQARSSVSNQLGITLDSVQITLYNHGENSPLVTIAIGGPIATGDSAVGSGPIRPGAVAPSWDFALRFYTPGGTILSADNKYVSVSAELPTGLRVASATGVIPAFTRDFADSISISSEHAVYAAAFRSGILRMTWGNTTPLPFDVQWTCGNLTRAGVPLGGHTTVGALGSTDATIDLAGCEFAGGGSASQARIAATVQTVGSSGTTVTLHSTDGVTVTTAARDLVLESATVALARTVQSVEWKSFALNLPSGLGDIGLDGGTCVLSITSSLPWSGHLSGQVSNERSTSIPINGTILPATDGHPVQTNIPVPGIAALLNPLSRNISFTATVEYGDGATVGTVHATDYLLPKVILTSPADIFADSVALQGDVSHADLSGSSSSDRRGRLVRGDVEITITNHLPLGAKLTLKLAGDSTSLSTSPRMTIGPATIAPAPMNAQGQATGDSTTTLRFSIHPEDVSLFEQDSIWAVGDVMLIGPGGGVPSRISASDRITWNASARLEVRTEAAMSPEESR